MGAGASAGPSVGPDALMEEYVSRLRDLFLAIDLDDSGTIDLAELRQLAENGTDGVLSADTDIDALFESWDIDQNGEIDEDEWIEMWVLSESERGLEYSVDLFSVLSAASIEAMRLRERALFSLLDLDESGDLDLTEVQAFCQSSEELQGLAPSFIKEWGADASEEAGGIAAAKVTIEGWLAMWETSRMANPALHKQTLQYFADVATRSASWELFQRMDLDQVRVLLLLLLLLLLLFHFHFHAHTHALSRQCSCTFLFLSWPFYVGRRFTEPDALDLRAEGVLHWLK